MLDMGALSRGNQVSRRFRAAPEGGAEQLVDNPNAILFIDEIHTLIGAGAASGGTLDASNLLKPALSSGALKCIGGDDLQRVPRRVRKRSCAVRGASEIDVPEPSVEETVAILRA